MNDNVNESKLFLGGVAWASTEESLKESFGKAGTVVSVRIITDKRTGKSKGYAFVEMSSPAEAQAAIQMYNGQQIDGRPVTVNVARPMERR